MIYVELTIITDTTADKFIFNVSTSLICICQQFIMHNVGQEGQILYILTQQYNIDLR